MAFGAPCQADSMSAPLLPLTTAAAPGRRRIGVALALGAAITALFIVVALVAPFWTPWDTGVISVQGRLRPPGLQHWLGTDALGRDLLSMLMKGATASIGVACVAVLVGAGVGVPLGLWGAARGGWVDELLMRANDVIFAFPALLLAILMTTFLGPGAVNAMLAIGIFNIPVFARVVRGSALGLWTRDFVLAAHVAGKGQARISYEHVLPNLAGLLWVQLSIQLSLGIVAETGLSYIGLGTQPPRPSWGRMLADAQTLTVLAPTLAVFTGIAVVLAVLGLHLLGDGLRDRLDPRLQGAGVRP